SALLDVRNQYAAVGISCQSGDCLWTVSDPLKLAIPLAYQIGALRTDPQLSASVRKQLQYRNLGTDGDGSKRHRPEIEAVETNKAFSGSNAEVSICGLRDGIDCVAGKSGFGGPLFADVL